MITVSRFLEGQEIYTHPQNRSDPMVTVILPSYKLREGGMNQRAIESVLRQTFDDFEFIIVDDGSLDGLFPLLRSYQEKDSRIILVRHAINSGLHAIRLNEAIMMAKGKYIAYMFEDDEWYPNALKCLVDTILGNGGNGLAYGTVDMVIHRPDGSVVSNQKLGNWDFNYALLRGSNQIAHCGVLHSRSVLEECGLYDPNILLRRWCDYDLWLRMAKYTPFFRCSEVIGKVVAGTKDTLAANIAQDMTIIHRYLGSERDDCLLPEHIADYPVDSLPFSTNPQDAYYIREHHIIPFWVQHPAILTPGERHLILANRLLPNRLLVTKPSYSTSVDVTLTNFDSILPKGIQSFAFVTEANLSAMHPDGYDTLILYRTIGVNSLVKMIEARRHSKPVIYMLDDNMFKFGQGYMAEEFFYLKSGSAGLRVVEDCVSGADLTISYSLPITQECHQYTPRVFELSTNIKEKYVSQAEPLPGGKSTGRRLRYAVISGNPRRREIQALWGQFQRFFHNHRDEVEFHMWGMNPADFGTSDCPVYYRPFDHSYASYLRALLSERFDYVISPLFDDHDAKVSKSPIKYLETTVAGAVGIYSDSPVYTKVENNRTGIKVTEDGWLDALETSFQWTDEKRASIFAAAREHILNEFTTEIQSLDYLTALEVASLHSGLLSREMPDKKAAIAYFFHESLFGGATQHLAQHALMASQFNFLPVLCFQKGRPIAQEMLDFAQEHGISIVQLNFTSSNWKRDITQIELINSNELAAWMEQEHIRLVHMVNYCPDVAKAASLLSLPVVATFHAYYEPPVSGNLPEAGEMQEQNYLSVIHSSSLRFAWKWSSEFNTPAFCIRAPIAERYFNSFVERCGRSLPEKPTLLVSGTLQKRKGQLEAIRAVGLLARKGITVRLVLAGYDDLVPDYVLECKKKVEALGLQAQVEIPGFSADPSSYYRQADFILCASDFESMPQSILKAMASGIRVITTPCGGVKELVQDGFSGIITNGYHEEDIANAIERAVSLSDEQWEAMLKNAHLVAGMSCASEVVGYQLMKLYNYAVARTTGGGLKIGSRPEGQTSSVNERVSIDWANFSANDTNTFARPIPPHGLVYPLTISEDNWDTLAVVFATYGHKNKIPVDVIIHSGEFPFRVVRKVRIPADRIVDNLSFMISFPPIPGSAKRKMLVHIRPAGMMIKPVLALYERGTKPPRWRQILDLIIPTGGQLHHVVLFSTALKIGSQLG